MFKTVTGGKSLSAHGIAAKITKSAELLLAERNLAALRQELATLGEEIKEVATELRETGAIGSARLDRLMTKQRDLDNQVRTVKALLTPLRAAHVAEVEKTLSGRRADNDRKILAALESLQAPLLDNLAIDSEIRAAGGNLPFSLDFSAFEPVRQMLRRRLGEV